MYPIDAISTDDLKRIANIRRMVIENATNKYNYDEAICRHFLSFLYWERLGER